MLMSLSPRITDGTGVVDRGGVKVGETGMDKQVGTLRMLPLEMAAELASPGGPAARLSDSSSAIGWNRKSLE